MLRLRRVTRQNDVLGTGQPLVGIAAALIRRKIRARRHGDALRLRDISNDTLRVRDLHQAEILQLNRRRVFARVAGQVALPTASGVETLVSCGDVITTRAAEDIARGSGNGGDVGVDDGVVASSGELDQAVAVYYGHEE